ncbi:SIS domain-containing protein [Acidisoma cellulosilytica]|uniref:SIS domain-containing protein n=1 Tax=Acidisoma cellulosilyticum TaxID=2802395 RepID=A0A964E620_9PROT|nr:SIS domain-containing protein [Acidisoma cellulosilyticum]MCB8883139.1 SIS domain-containing protein [Acidisoma cellulosilyticum]
MKNFDEDRFLRIQTGAVRLARPIDEAIAAAIAAGADSLFFLGTGGAGILMEPATLLMAEKSLLSTFNIKPAELVLTGHKHLSSKSIVVVPSLSGTTKESVAALKFCKNLGATTISLVGHADSPLGQGADFNFVNFAEDDTSCESFYLQSIFIALSVMKARGEAPDYQRIVNELAMLPALMLDVKRAIEPQADHHAKAIAASGFHIISGSGSTWPEAFYYGMCILEEMQWIKTRPVHASDFFHGTLELVEQGVSVMLFKGEDGTRSLVDRAETFARDYTDAVAVFDTRDCALPGISDDVRALISPILLATMFERISAHLEVLRNHPLTTRRYYKKVAY